MLSSGNFDGCENPETVHNKLIALLACDFLDENLCVNSFKKFRINARIYLSPAERNLTTTLNILDALEEKGHLGVGNYYILKELTSDVDARIIVLIEEAEKKIKSFGPTVFSNERKAPKQEVDCKEKGNATQTKKGRSTKSRKETGDRSQSEPKKKHRKVETQKTTTNKDKRIQHLQDVLYEINHAETENVQVSPLQKSSKISVDELYVPVLIREDLENVGDYEEDEKGHEEEDEDGLKPEEENKTSTGRYVQTPEDIFCKDKIDTRSSVRYVILQGEAARGKSVYCLRLAKIWCDAKRKLLQKEDLSPWEKFMVAFEFLFLVTLRDVNKGWSSLIDMICFDIFGQNADCHDTIREVLTSNQHRCLIIMDGLDEWKYNPEIRPNLSNAGMPNIFNIASSTFFITLRPWKFDEIAHVLRKGRDRVLEILGLDDKSILSVAENVLHNCFNMKSRSNNFKRNIEKIKEKLQDSEFKSIMQIPILAITCTIMCVRDEKVGKSMTSFYISLVMMLIERAFENKVIDRAIIQKFDKRKTLGIECAKSLQKLRDFMGVLITLGKVAYNDLVSAETNLIFEKIEMEKDVGDVELDFALKVGILSEKEASGSIFTKNVSLNFFHKSIQEFLAAVNIVSKADNYKLFCGELCTIKAVLEHSNTIKVITGLSPVLGSKISQHIADIMYHDESMVRYRNGEFVTGKERKGSPLCEVLIRCFMEWKTEHAAPDGSLPSLPFIVSDIDVHYGEKENIKAAISDLLNHHEMSHLQSITTLSLKKSIIPIWEEYNKILDEFLKKIKLFFSKQLQRLNLHGFSIHSISIPSLRCLTLSLCTISTDRKYEEGKYGTEVSPLLIGMTELRSLAIWDLSLGGRSLGLTLDMVNLAFIELHRVEMSEEGWNELTTFLINIKQEIRVILVLYSKDPEYDLTTINSYPCFSVSKYSAREYSSKLGCFDVCGDVTLIEMIKNKI